MKYTKFFSLSALFLLASTALASPCAGIDRSLADERKTVLAPIVKMQVAKDLENIESVEVLQSFHFHNWYILRIETNVSDQGYLFYNGDPTKTPYLTVWGGSVPGTDEEYRSIVKTLSQGNTKGIPKALARCFAWHMTKEQNK